jgi:UDP-N-acetylmuramoylalanine--D-glutamate ligase
MNADLAGKHVVVIGAARTGRAAARVLAAGGAHVRVLERNTSAPRDRDWPADVELRLGADETAEGLDGIDLVVPSPGIPRTHPVLRRAVARDIPVWSEIELSARLLNCPVLAITGTNGKSTTTTLLGNMLKADGRRVFVGGNLGTPLADAVSSPEPWDAAVAEVSSFQLEWVPSFRPALAVLLNLTPDHQDRYVDLADYAAAKANLLAHLESRDIAVLNRDDAWVWEQRRRTCAIVRSFGRDPVQSGTCVEGEDVVVRGTGPERRYRFVESPLTGAHNRENLLAAITAAAAWGISSDAIRAGMRETRGLPHRLEFVRERDGVRWYDDSKATNVGAVEKSIDSFPGGIVLLLGGSDKGGDFAALRPRIASRVAHVICFGQAGPHIADQLGPGASGGVVDGLASAVQRAAELARPEQVVVLAPGCASFDEFRDYAERGARFRAWVEAL